MVLRFGGEGRKFGQWVDQNYGNHGSHTKWVGGKEKKQDNQSRLYMTIIYADGTRPVIPFLDELLRKG